MEGDGDGEELSDLGEASAIELLLDDLGVSGLEAPGDIEVGLGDKRLNFSVFSGVSACTEEGGEETGGEAEAVEEDSDAADDDERQIFSSSGSGECGEIELSGLSSGSSSVKIQLSSCSCITLSSIWRTRSFSGDKSSSSSVMMTAPADSLSGVR